MSVVAVKRYEDRIEFAADSIAVRGATKTTNNFSKLETINGLVVGGVGSIVVVAACVDFCGVSHTIRT